MQAVPHTGYQLCVCVCVCMKLTALCYVFWRYNCVVYVYEFHTLVYNLYALAHTAG